ncbi:MAG: sigma-70 family RNA polymerase sigma factor [Tannerella sp.]|jgi:RNA polymerase sigma factor (sigma-70 family)|nr:sigma-70 family RNA polymerase sigma factor [Tannerella sp.]
MKEEIPTGQSGPVEEQLLWEMFLSGDDRAYAYFYVKYTDDLFAYGMRFTPDRELVKDAIQDVFVKIYSNRTRLNKIDKVKPYLFMALKNTLFNVFQKEKALYHIDTIEPVFITEYPVEDMIIADEQEAERKQRINQLLEALTPRQKEVIYYRYVEGMKLDDICKLMEMNYQSVQNLIQRAIGRIRSVYAGKSSSALNVRLMSQYL